MDDQPTFSHSQSVNQSSLTSKERYDALEQTANLLRLQKEEFSKEICKLHKENEQLKTRCKALEEQHTEIHDNHKSMKNTFHPISTELDVAHVTIDKLEMQLLERQQTIKILKSENNDLITQNNQYKQRLEELDNQTIQRNETYAKEKDISVKKIQSLELENDQLHHQLYIETLSVNGHKHTERAITPSVSLRGKNKTQRMPFDFFLSRENSMNSNANETLENMAANLKLSLHYDLPTLLDTPRIKTKRVRFADEQYTGSDAENIHSRNVSHEYKNKLTELEDVVTQTLNETYDDALERLKKMENNINNYENKLIELNELIKKQLNEQYNDVLERNDQLQKKLNKKSNTINDLRKENLKLSKQTDNKSCYVFDFFN